MIDDEIRRIIEEAETKARDVLTEHMDDLHRLAKALLEYETLSGEDVQKLLRGESIDRAEEPGSTSAGPSGRRSSVPSSGKAAKGKEPPGGLEPEPQPGA